MRPTWKAMAAWPYPDTGTRRTGTYQVPWDQMLDDLGTEVERSGGTDLEIALVTEPANITASGSLRAGAKVGHPGAIVSFDHPTRGRLFFKTAIHPVFHHNLRAISLGLTALRAIDRYGIGEGGEQYQGFALLAAGGGSPSRGKELVERHGGIRKALRATHPDHGGNGADLADVQAYKEQVGA